MRDNGVKGLDTTRRERASTKNIEGAIFSHFVLMSKYSTVRHKSFEFYGVDYAHLTSDEDRAREIRPKPEVNSMSYL